MKRITEENIAYEIGKIMGSGGNLSKGLQELSAQKKVEQQPKEYPAKIRLKLESSIVNFSEIRKHKWP